ncbi:Protein of unknown function (DUF2851) [Apibacter mensalis]|uniref:DUF2851 domain-containing protein n=1 Tax=Apibacter mensalis TaxID=1586267 RepID=A0A0X3ARB4_9FLAO|nr:DUF2851 family protein [Apibacter mensalis]CVK16941.1 Protein of unknown function (DUF2851) [Apibacter mensalis]
MKEELLHHIWQFKKFNTQNLYTIEGNKVEIIDVGSYNTNAGPDFIFARIKIDNIECNGNVEIHVKSSDWSKHNLDNNYSNLILHVVYEVDDNNNKILNSYFPILELKSYISNEIRNNYNLLGNSTFQFIPCENLINNSLFSNIFSVSENLYLDKLENKCVHIYDILKRKKNDWEATLTTVLAHTLGLKINADAFEHLFLSLDYRIIRKISKSQFQMESLLFGITHDLKNKRDSYPQDLYKEFKFIQTKFNIPNKFIDVKYFRLRPLNFPSIRLSQLANIISKYQNLFSYIIGIKSVNQYYRLLDDVKSSDYWTDHYVFDKKTVRGNEKKLSKSQKDLIILNAFLPIKFAYSKNIGKPLEEEIFEILYEIRSENNSIIQKYNNLGVKFNSALDSQAYLYLYKNKCLKKQCLSCVIGYKILK